jgi:hypothetical protein
MERDKVEMLRGSEQTDELRRLALQLALQLPASVNEARRVLELTSECLDEFLIEQHSARARARRLWRGPKPVEPVPAPAALPGIVVFLCCFGILAAAGGIGAAALHLTGYGAAGTNMLAVTAIALLFGRNAAISSALGAFLLTNWAVVPPAWDLDPPTTYEFVGLGLSIIAAIAVPWIQAQREPLRRASLRAVRRPLQLLRRRAA